MYATISHWSPTNSVAKTSVLVTWPKIWFILGTFLEGLAPTGQIVSKKSNQIEFFGLVWFWHLNVKISKVFSSKLLVKFLKKNCDTSCMSVFVSATRFGISLWVFKKKMLFQSVPHFSNHKGIWGWAETSFPFCSSSAKNSLKIILHDNLNTSAPEYATLPSRVPYKRYFPCAFYFHF